jgi:DNA-directed RNA polymerase subunit RPC12/RpoP
MSDGAHDLLVRGIAAAKAGERAEARHYLEWALRQEPSSDEQLEAWLWLSDVAEVRDEARRWLEEVLANDPHNPRALRRLAVLDGRLLRGDMIDPDQPLPAPVPQDNPVDVERFACPTCGGPLAYAPDGEGLQCDHCGRRTTIAGGEPIIDPAVENDFVLALATARGHARPQASPTFACAACGARFLLAPETLALTCPYCDATYAVEAGDERMLIAPDTLVPLMVSAEEARASLEVWSRKTGGIGKSFVIDRLAAVYLPVWLFEMGGVIDWTAAPGENRWAMEAGPLSGTEPPVSPIAVLAKSNPPPGQAESVENVSPDLFVSYDTKYLAAWPAESYSLSLADAALRARERSLDATATRLSAAARGLRPAVRSARMVVESFRLTLVPVWMADARVGRAHLGLILSGVTAAVYRGARQDNKPAG